MPMKTLFLALLALAVAFSGCLGSGDDGGSGADEDGNADENGSGGEGVNQGDDASKEGDGEGEGDAADDAGQDAGDESSDDAGQGDEDEAPGDQDGSADDAGSDGEGGDAGDEATDDADQDAGDDAPEPVAVTISGFAFSPADVTVTPGTEVVWTNEDGAPHTATADGGAFNTGHLGQGESGSVTFDEQGTFEYYCEYHPSMRATIHVSA